MKNWNGKPYHSLDYMLRETFGEKVYKVTLNGGMSCPNRDGKLGTRGCIFCSEGGSGDFATARLQFFLPSARSTNTLRIFRHIRILTPRWNISGRFLQRRSIIRLW